MHKPPPEEDLSHSQITEIIFIATQLSTVKVSTTNMDRLHQRLTHQLLRGSSLLSRPSTLKLVSLLLGQRTSLVPRLSPRPDENLFVGARGEPENKVSRQLGTRLAEDWESGQQRKKH